MMVSKNNKPCKNGLKAASVEKCVTKRALDKRDSARFSSRFLALGFSCLSNGIHVRPPAGDAHRWATHFFSDGNAAHAQMEQIKQE